MTGEALATWIVEFDASGAKAVDSAVQEITSQLHNADSAAKEMAATSTAALKGMSGAAMTAAFSLRDIKKAMNSTTTALNPKAVLEYADRLAKAEQDAARKVKEAHEDQQKAIGRTIAAYGISVFGVLAFARAGLQGTAEGVRLGYMFQQIAREVTSVFLPAINAVISVLQKVLAFFRSMSGEQQALISKTVLLAVAVKALSAAFAFSPIAGFLAGVALAATVCDRLADALGPIVSVFRWIADSGLGGAALTFVATAGGLLFLGAAGTAAGGAIWSLVFGTSAATVASGESAIAAYAASSGFGTMTATANGAAGAVARLTVALKAFVLAHPWLAAGAAILGALAAFFNFGKKSDRAQAQQAASGPEELEQTWWRIQKAGSGTDLAQQTRERQLTALMQIAQNTGKKSVNDAWGNAVALVP